MWIAVTSLKQTVAYVKVCSLNEWMDIHKNYLQVAVLDEKGMVLDNFRVDNNLTKVSEFFDSLHPDSKNKVVMESSGMWYNI